MTYETLFKLTLNIFEIHLKSCFCIAFFDNQTKSQLNQCQDERH